MSQNLDSVEELCSFSTQSRELKSVGMRNMLQVYHGIGDGYGECVSARVGGLGWGLRRKIWSI